LQRACLAAIALLGTGIANAAIVTEDVGALDQIFAQAPVLDRTPIDIRFAPAITLNQPTLTHIDTEKQLNTLFDVGSGSNVHQVNLFFVDAINECNGEMLPQAIGCGQEPGRDIAVESKFASRKGMPGSPGLGAVLIAHELGHTLGLPHFTGTTPNLMDATLNGEWVLTSDQVTTILASDLVQRDQSGARFISIQPFAVVPEPGTFAFVVGAAFVLGAAGWRRAQG
jgi:hypothetical protein